MCYDPKGLLAVVQPDHDHKALTKCLVPDKHAEPSRSCVRAGVG